MGDALSVIPAAVLRNLSDKLYEKAQKWCIYPNTYILLQGLQMY